MSDDLKQAFNILDINTKRNQISDELIIIHELIKQFEALKNIKPITTIKNYDSVKDENLTESEILTFFYEDIFNIQQELISLLSSEQNSK